MAASVNKVILIGHLGKDPEIRVTQEGLKIATFPLATSETWKDKQTGERKEKTEWHKIVIMNEQLAGIAEKYLTKGSKVYLEGQLQTRKWVDQAGQEKYTTEIILGKFKGELTLLDSKQGNFGNEETAYSAPHNPFQSPHQSSKKETKQKIDLDDDIPF